MCCKQFNRLVHKERDHTCGFLWLLPHWILPWGENFYEFTWGSTHRDACTPSGATWHDTIWSWNQARFVTTTELTDGAGCKAIAASTTSRRSWKCQHVDRKLWQPANLRTVSTTKNTPVPQTHLTILATDYQQWDHPWWTLELWFLPRSDDCGLLGWQKLQISLSPAQHFLPTIHRWVVTYHRPYVTYLLPRSTPFVPVFVYVVLVRMQ